MSDQTNKIFLIDLSKQFPFEIDDDKKNQLCFSETLIISCAHFEGDVDKDSILSDWSCTDSCDDKNKDIKDDNPKIIQTVDSVQDDVDYNTVEKDEDDNFQFYFFPDCLKAIPKNSRDSIMLQDGIPILKSSNKKEIDCTCTSDKEGKCSCFLKIGCTCGAKATDDCTCSELDNICICDDKNPQITCTCKSSNVCLCHPDGKPQLVCDCGDTNTDKESICQGDDPENIHADPITPECTCNESSSYCKCFPPPKTCSCGSSDNCQCFAACECIEPCICNTLPKTEICSCSEMKTNLTDTCPPCEKDGKTMKLKKTKADKHGYRWCHEVDAKHTFFDYAYDRHDKIDYKEQEKEKLKILGLYEETKQESKCEVHEIQAPQFKKKVRKPSLDCCSAVGGINISVEMLGEDKDKFLVQVVSHSSKEGAKCGSKLVSIIDCSLHTLEENRTEYITKTDVTKERRSYMTICENGYYNKVTRICGERNLVKRIYHSFEDAHNFLLEGANVVLLRYFGISRYKGRIKTDTVLMNGTICESVYVCLGVSQAMVNGKPLFVAKVERHIIEPSGFIHQTLTVLTLRGYIVSHEWADNSYIFHVNPLLRVIPEKDEIEPHEPLRANWRSDLQLLSDYLDFKSARTSEGARYVAENGELTGMIRDYLQALLLLRPSDALHFTREYFGSTLSDLDLPHNEFFEPCHKNVRYYFFED